MPPGDASAILSARQAAADGTSSQSGRAAVVRNPGDRMIDQSISCLQQVAGAFAQWCESCIQPRL